MSYNRGKKVKQTNNKNITPPWFNGDIYKKGNTVTNPWTNQSIHLNNIELSIYDFIMGAEMMGFGSLDKVSMGKSWFRRTNFKAYMTLLD